MAQLDLKSKIEPYEGQHSAGQCAELGGLRTVDQPVVGIHVMHYRRSANLKVYSCHAQELYSVLSRIRARPGAKAYE